MIERAWLVKPDLVRRVGDALNLNPLALKAVSRRLNSSFRDFQTGLLDHTKFPIFIDCLKKEKDILPFLEGKSAERLLDEFLIRQIIAPKDEGAIILRDFEHFKRTAEAEDVETATSFASETIKGIKISETSQQVAKLFNCLSEYLVDLGSRFGYPAVDSINYLLRMAEDVLGLKTNEIEKKRKVHILEQLSITREVKVLIHKFLQIVTTEAEVNRAIYFSKMMTMAIGSVSRSEHEGKMRRISEIGDPAKLVEESDIFNPDEDKLLNDQAASIKLPKVILEYPIQVEKGMVYQILEGGQRAAIECDFMENYSNLEIYKFIWALEEGLKFEGKPVEDFVIVPIKNGKYLGLLYLDQAYNETPVKVNDLVKLISFAGPQIDAAQKREKEKAALVREKEKEKETLVEEREKAEVETRKKEEYEFISGLFNNWKRLGKTEHYFGEYKNRIIGKNKGQKEMVDIAQIIDQSRKGLGLSNLGVDIKVRIQEEYARISFERSVLQGVIDGMFMEAVWAIGNARKREEMGRADKRQHGITIEVKYEGSKFTISQTNTGVGVDIGEKPERLDLDLGSYIVIESLEPRPAEKVGDWGISTALSHISGLKVTLKDV